MSPCPRTSETPIPAPLPPRLASRLAERGRLDALVHNAGAMFPERELTPDGLERTYQVHVAGPFLLTRLLVDTLASRAPARVVTVTSGGMYAERLDLTSPILRDADQGADSMVWLALADSLPGSGRLWHDRRPRSAHRVPWTRPQRGEAARLWDRVSRDVGLDPAI